MTVIDRTAQDEYFADLSEEDFSIPAPDCNRRDAGVASQTRLRRARQHSLQQTAGKHRRVRTKRPRWALCLGILLLGIAAWPTSPAIPVSVAQSDASAALDSTADAVPVPTPIRDIRVGQRVTGRNPLIDDATRATFQDPDPATWRQVDLWMTKADGTRLDITLLRPLSWIQLVGAEVGATIQLDLYELGAVGRAHVTVIGPCPSIRRGAGRAVTGTFRHDASGNILNLYVEGQEKPIGVTENHPFWSEDRQEFVRTAQLRPGERLRTPNGIVLVDRIGARDRSQTVYNLEVGGEHVYEVTDLGILVHNSCSVHKVTSEISEGSLFDATKRLRGNGTSIRESAPILIPKHVTPRAKVAGSGARSIHYKWRSRGFEYEARFHEASPGAPTGSPVSWRVTRRKPGPPHSVFNELVGGHGNVQWVTRGRYNSALARWHSGTATATDLKYVDESHFLPVTRQ